MSILSLLFLTRLVEYIDSTRFLLSTNASIGKSKLFTFNNSFNRAWCWTGSFDPSHRLKAKVDLTTCFMLTNNNYYWNQQETANSIIEIGIWCISKYYYTPQFGLTKFWITNRKKIAFLSIEWPFILVQDLFCKHFSFLY